MKSNQLGFTALELIITIVYIVGIWGWVWNIIKIVESGFDIITGMFIVRCIGVFIAPLGAVIGFL